MDNILGFMQETASEGGGTLSTLMYIASAAGLWKMFEKAGLPGWYALIPFYNIYKLCEITIGNGWYFLRLLWACIPFVGWIVALYYAFKIGEATAKSYGQDQGWAWGYLLISPVFYCITGFGNYDYYGVSGVNDSRTSDARGAKTVNFDVIENKPEETPNVEQANAETVHVEQANAEAAKPEPEEEVEFVFNQDDVE